MNIAVVMGGYSDESVISLRSGQLILNHLNKDKYQVFEVHILNEGWYVKIDDKKLPINKANFSFENNVFLNAIIFEIHCNTSSYRMNYVFLQKFLPAQLQSLNIPAHKQINRLLH